MISVGDARGIGVVKAPEVNGTALTIEPGTGLEQGGQGVHIPLPEGDWRKQNLKLNMDALYSNTGALKLSVGELNDAVNKLYGGTKDLASGTSEFVDKTYGYADQR